MPQLQFDLVKFESIYTEPTIDRMLRELSDHEFEHFVGYVFERAGFNVEDTAGQYGQGLDLRLHATDARKFGVSVKHFTPPGNVVNGPQMMLFRGALLNGLAGITVTTSYYNGPAMEEALKKPRILALNGEQFLRYITYVRDTHGMARANPSGVFTKFPSISPAVFVETASDQRKPTSETKVLTVANHKGGVGKTTTALNLGFGLAAKGYQVLLVDLDTQANLTKSLAYPRSENVTPLHIGQYFDGTYTLAQLVSPTAFSSVWLLPSAHALRHMDRGLAAGPEQEIRLLHDLHAESVAPPQAVDGRRFDWIIIDTGPSMGFFTRSALAASDYVILPLEPAAFADMGLELLVDTRDAMQALIGHPIEILGAVVTQWRDDALNRQLLAAATLKLSKANIRVFDTKVPLDKTNIERAYIETGQGRRRQLLDRTCPSAKAYKALVEEVL